MGNHVFICYAREDQKFVFELATTLKDLDIPVWLDQWDIPLGADWDQAIDSALNECARFLIVLSPMAVGSREVRGELRIALDVNKPIVPVLYQACQIPRQLRTIQYVDFTVCGLDDEAAVHRVVRALHVPGIKAEVRERPPRKVEQEQKRRAVEEARLRMAEVKQGLEVLTQWAGARWAEAGEQEAGAEQARQAQDYEQAAERYARACQLYEAARREAEEARLCERAVAASRQAEQTQIAAEQAEAPQYAQEFYEKAAEAKRRGEQSLEAQRWVQAAEEFGQARELFAQTIQSGQSERAKQATAAFQRVGQARLKAEQAGARERFPAEFAQAQHLVGQGYECKEREEFVQAVGFYKQAEQHFVRLCRQATLQAVQENAEDARRRMREVKERVSALREWAEAVWTEAEEGETCGEQAYEAQDYEHASASYERACQAYEQVGVAGQREQLRHKALAARQRTVAAREEAEQVEAERYAPGPLSRAIAAQGEAEQRWQAQDYEQAAERYARACQLYEAARVEAEEERGRQQAKEARRQAEEMQKAVEEAEAQRYTQEFYERAVEAMRQGEQRFKAKRWEEAANKFIQAKELFDQSLEGAKRVKARQAAEAARDSALVEQREAQGGRAAELFPEGVAEAVALLRQGEQKLIQQDYSTAQAVFERSTALFRQVGEEAVVHLQREQAKEARARAHEVQDRLASVKKGRPQRRAHKTLAQGDRLFQQGSYVEARVKYEEAVSLLSALLQTSLAAPPERKIALVARPFVLYSVFILGLLSVAIVLYLALPPSYRETLPEIAEGKKALEQGDLGRAELAAHEHEQAEREASIAKLLNEARKALAGDQLMTPAGENAVELAAQVLVLEPGHQGAQQILAEVVTRYVGLGEAALSKNQLVKAQVHYKTAQGLVQRYPLPDSEVGRLAERIAAQEQRLAEEAEQKRLAEEARRKEEAKRLAEEEQRRKAQAAQIETLLSKARQALAANRLTAPAGDNAVEYAEQLLALAPKQGGARQVLIEVVGRCVAQGEVALSQGNLAGAQGYRDVARQVATKYRLPETKLRSLSEQIARTEKHLAQEQIEETRGSIDARDVTPSNGEMKQDTAPKAPVEEPISEPKPERPARIFGTF